MNWKRRDKDIKVPILEYLEDLIKEQLALNRKVVVAVGTDSQNNGGGGKYKFATVILMTVKEDLGGGVFKGLGGKIIQASYILKVPRKGKEGVNERMLLEVSKSMEVAYMIAPLLEKYGIKMELHVDINPDPAYESNKALSAAVGWVLAMGYEVKSKPNAFAASYCADKNAH